MVIRHTKGHILLVEDQPLLAANIKHLLNNAGYKVTLCEDARHVPTVLAYRKDIDLLLTDNDAPYDADAGAKLAQSNVARHLPVILWSGDNGFLEKTYPPNVKCVWKKTYGMQRGEPFIEPRNRGAFLELIASMMPERSSAPERP